MGIISKIKSVLGVAGDGRERSGDRGTVTSADAEPETTNERAVKGGDQTSARRASDQAGGAAETVAADRSDEDPADEPGDTSDGARVDQPGDTAGEPSGASGDPVDSIKGVGSAYAQRLADAGVDSVAELARADPEELAAATDLGTGRVEKWVERARARTGNTDR